MASQLSPNEIVHLLNLYDNKYGPDIKDFSNLSREDLENKILELQDRAKKISLGCSQDRGDYNSLVEKYENLVEEYNEMIDFITGEGYKFCEECYERKKE